MQARMAMNAAQHKIINLLKTFFLLISFRQCLCIECVGQDNSSSSSVAQRCQKVEHPHPCVNKEMVYINQMSYVKKPGVVIFQYLASN